MDAQDELLSAAVEFTRAASGLAAQRFLNGVPASTKADGTEVTPADSEVEQLVRSLITRDDWPSLGHRPDRRHFGLRSSHPGVQRLAGR
jgi:hypothetical protein